MTRTLSILALAAVAALAGCGNEDHNIVSGPADPAANQTANADIQLPPSILASKIYRCRDNSVVYIDWLSDNKSANLRTEQNGAATHVTAPEAGQPMTAENGTSLTGSATDNSISVTLPGEAERSCHV